MTIPRRAGDDPATAGGRPRRWLGVEALADAVIEMALAVALAVLVFRALCAAPAATLTAVALVALAIGDGLVPVPESPLATRIEHAAANVERWQDRRADEISCEARTFRALGRGDHGALERDACR